MMKTKIREKNYEIEDPTQFFIDLFTFSKENHSYFPKGHWELVLGALIGGMGSGKSTLINFIAAMGQKIYAEDFSCYQTDNVVNNLEELNKTPKKRTSVMFFFVDDALTKPGSDSRRAMSAENVEASQDLSVIRHLLANENEFGVPDPRFEFGFCVIFYAIQDPNRLDPFIRRNLHIALYKTYYDVLDKMLDTESLMFIKSVTEDSMYRHDYSKRSYALGITKTGGIMRLFFPKTDFSIPIVYSDGPNYQKIINAVMELDLDTVKDNVVKGFIFDYCLREKIRLNPKDIGQIISLARYYHYMGSEDHEEITPTRKSQRAQQDTFMQEIYEKRQNGISWRQMGALYDMSASSLYDQYHRYCNRNKITPI